MSPPDELGLVLAVVLCYLRASVTAVSQTFPRAKLGSLIPSQ